MYKWIRDHIFPTVVGAILLGIAGWIYVKFTSTLKVEIGQLLIVAANEDSLTSCRFVVRIDNTFNDPKTVSFREVHLMDNLINCSLPFDTKSLEVEGNGQSCDTISFSDKKLDVALQLVQRPDIAKFSFEYLVVGEKDTYTLFLSDSNVEKCSFWQNPLFETDKEGFDAGGTKQSYVMWITYRTQDGEIDSVRKGMSFFLHPNALSEIDLNALSHSLFDSLQFKKSGFDFGEIRAHFRRRYGGIYAGMLKGDDVQVVTISEALEGLTPSESYDILGFDIGFDITKIEEFIHYSFNLKLDRAFFQEYQENSKYFVVFSVEEVDSSQNIQLVNMSNEMRRIGFRGGFEQDTSLGTLPKVLTDFSDTRKYQNIVSYLNSNIDSINRATAENGAIILWLGNYEKQVEQRIINTYSKVFDDHFIHSMTFDCRPLIYKNNPSHYSDLVVVFSHFGSETRGLSYEKFELTENGIKRTRFHRPRLR